MTYFGGANTDADTAAMLSELQRVTGLSILLTQGSYSTSVSASAGTHSGGGVVDLNLSGWDYPTIQRVISAGRSMGGVGWYRTPAEGFSYHVHMVRVDCADLAPAARAQVVQYYAGQNGLANHGPDDSTRAYVGMTWAKYRGGAPTQNWANQPAAPAHTSNPTPPAPPEVDVTPEQDNRLKNIEQLLQFPGGGGASWGQALANQDGKIIGQLNDIWTQGLYPGGGGATWAQALANQLGTILTELQAIQAQGQVPNAGYDWLPALNNKLDAIFAALPKP